MIFVDSLNVQRKIFLLLAALLFLCDVTKDTATSRRLFDYQQILKLLHGPSGKSLKERTKLLIGQ